MTINDWVQLGVGILAFVIGFVKLSKGFASFDKQLALINYTLFNAGKTGLVNKVDELLERQAEIKTDVAVLKVKTRK